MNSCHETLLGLSIVVPIITTYKLWGVILNSPLMSLCLKAFFKGGISSKKCWSYMRSKYLYMNENIELGAL